MAKFDLLGHLGVLMSPFCWLRNYPTSAALTEFIECRLDAGDRPVIVDDFEMNLGGATLWRRNYPYAYGSLRHNEADKWLPSRRAVIRLRAAELLVANVGGDAKVRDALATLGGSR